MSLTTAATWWWWWCSSCEARCPGTAADGEEGGTAMGEQPRGQGRAISSSPRTLVACLEEVTPAEHGAHVQEGVAATAGRVVELDHEPVQVLLLLLLRFAFLLRLLLVAASPPRGPHEGATAPQIEHGGGELLFSPHQRRAKGVGHLK